jgi:hypothetical protein
VSLKRNTLPRVKLRKMKKNESYAQCRNVAKPTAADLHGTSISMKNINARSNKIMKSTSVFSCTLTIQKNQNLSRDDPQSIEIKDKKSLPPRP